MPRKYDLFTELSKVKSDCHFFTDFIRFGSKLLIDFY